MELIIRLWKNFKVQPEIWFFYGFLLTFTLTIRKVLLFFPLRGEFNEYSGIYLYLSDIFLLLTLMTWVITILYNKIDILSIYRNIFSRKTECSTPASYHENVPRLPRSKEMFHVEHFFRYRGGTLIYILLPLVLVVWSFISLIWAENKFVSIFRSLKILEFYLLYVFILVKLFYWNTLSKKEYSTLAPYCENIPRGTFSQFTGWNILKEIFSFIMIIGLFQAIIGIIQFFLQHSIGLFWLKESLISPDIAGVAKIIFNGEAFIRAYGLFPHPNILGGFLMFSIFISWIYYKMFRAVNFDNVLLQKQEKCSTCLPTGRRGTSYEASVEHPNGLAWDILHYRHGTILFKLILGIQLLALFLTFSKSAIIGLFLGLIYYTYTNVPLHKECSTPQELFHVEQSTGQVWNILRGKRGTFIDFIKKKKRLIITVGLIIIFSFIIVKPDLYSFLFKSLNERLVYSDVSRGTIWNNPILGIGSGQFVISMENMPVIRESWMLQPVHNVFLLIWSELGLVGLLIFIVFALHVLLKNVLCLPRVLDMFHVEHIQNLRNGSLSEPMKTFGAIFIGLLFIMFFDHYLWDIQQGSFLLWMTLGFLVGASKCKNSIDKA